MSRTRIGRRFSQHAGLYIMLLPVLLYFIIFEYLPMFGLQIAFKEFDPMRGIWDSPWVGLEHFERFIDSYYFGRLLLNTVSLSVYKLVVELPFPIIMAVIVNELGSRRLRKWLQNVTYFPHFLSTVVFVGMMAAFLSPTGAINQIIGMLGYEPVMFMMEKDFFKSLYVFSDIWQNTGWASIIYLAVLTGIDPNLNEAAEMDGASRLQRIRFITIPHLMPTVVILLIMNTGKIMNVGFEKVLLMQNPLNMETSDVISTFVYRQGLLEADYSYATAVGLFTSLINLMLIWIVNTVSKKVSDASLW